MCWYCGSAITDSEPIGRSLACLDCGKDLRACRNCRHFRGGSTVACAESGAEASAERPRENDRANFCGWFSLNPRLREPTSGEKKSLASSQNARSAFDDLFKND